MFNYGKHLSLGAGVMAAAVLAAGGAQAQTGRISLKARRSLTSSPPRLAAATICMAG